MIWTKTYRRSLNTKNLIAFFGAPTAKRRCTLLVVWYAEMEQYPDEWMGMGPGDVLVVGDRPEEVVAQLDEAGVRRDSVVEFLNTNPMRMTL